MNPLRRKMASFLTEAARKGLKTLDSESPCARALKKIDVENILTEDINRICAAVSLTEISKISSLATRLKTAPEEKKVVIKGDIKKIAAGVVARVESKSGKLKTPEPCRHLLLNL